MKQDKLTVQRTTAFRHITDVSFKTAIYETMYTDI